MMVSKVIERGGLIVLPSFLILTLLFFYPCTDLQAQYKYDYEWMLGYNSVAPEDGQSSTSRFALTLLSFHQHPPDTIRTDIVGSAGASNTMSMANSDGELIFYSNGCSLFDPNGEVIEGAEELLFGPIFQDNCIAPQNEGGKAYRTLGQSTIPLPMDDRDSLFYLFYQRVEWERNAEGFTSPAGLVSFELYKKKVVKNETGQYVGKEKNLVLRQNLGQGFFTAVRDTKPHHWWMIIPPDVHLENYEIIRIGPEGVDTIFTYEEDYGSIHSDFLKTPYTWQSGQSVISPDGGTYIRWIADDTLGTLIYDFDQSAGELSNVRYLRHPERDSFIFLRSSFGGASISPNGRFLYLNTRENLYQYDLLAEDIESSLVHIAEFDGFVDPGNNFPVAFNQQKLAPDCKVYISATNTVRFMHVINHPNRKGLACDFQQHSFKLPGNDWRGLPYHPNYRLGTDYPVCDSTLTSTWFVPEEPEGQLHLYPNPARDYAVVGWTDMSPVEIALYDMSGREVYSNRIQPGSPEHYLDLSGFSAGVYVVRLRDREGNVGVERLVVL